MLVSLFVCFKAWVVEPEYFLGGGAGGLGSAGTSGGAGCGGIGKSSNITGTDLFWAGGGGECSPLVTPIFFYYFAPFFPSNFTDIKLSRWFCLTNDSRSFLQCKETDVC